MFKINKLKLDYFIKAKSRVNRPKVSNAWGDTNISEIRSNLRDDILVKEQKGVCAYCEKEIDSDSNNSNIDHFKTRNLFPQETLNYHNLLVSCNTKNRCSSYKDKSIKNKSEYNNIVNPVLEEPDDFFDYLPTGEITPINNKADFTINIFNMGIKESHSLVQERKLIAQALEYCYNDLSLSDIYQEFGDEFHSFIRNIYNKLKEN